ncbi:MAG: zinc ribbon domain-containing protein [Blastocatellia bacterium]
MFCPSCGVEELQPTQFCRACGAELHSVRTALQRPDTSASSTPDAREEIGRAIAAKIRELKDPRGLRRIVEDVLPQVEKFLETPEQKRLRTIRDGVITASVGIGLTLFMLLIGILVHTPQVLIACGAGILVFFIGFGIAASGWQFSGSPESQSQNSRAGSAGALIRELSGSAGGKDAEFASAVSAAKTDPQLTPPSVTEVTTRTLSVDRHARRE